MKKTCRAGLSLLLVLLLVTSLLPISAMAAENNPADITVPLVEPGDTMDVNNGTVTTNRGTVGINNGTVTENKKNVGINNGKIDTSNGTVTVNNEQIDTNAFAGKVETNNGTVTTNKGTVTTNRGTVGTNKGTVTENKKNVGINNGKIATSNGTVTENNKQIDTNAFAGKVETNNDTVVFNKGTVKTNAEDGTVKYNYGKVETNQGTVNQNTNLIRNGETVQSGSIDINKGTVDTNDTHINQNEGTVATNNGTVTTNNGQVGTYHEVEDPETGEKTQVADSDKGNFGTITTNGKTGTVTINQKGGTITTNNGAIETNEGTVNSNDVVIVYDEGGIDGAKSSIGTIEFNVGSIGTNNGLVFYNAPLNPSDTTSGVIEENRCMIAVNYGTVKTNGLQIQDQDGNPIVIDEDTVYGQIFKNCGTVETNAIDGAVENRSGSVEYSADDEQEPAEKLPPEGKVLTNFGTVKDVDGKTYYGLSWGDDDQNLTPLVEKDLWGTGIVRNTTINLDDYLKNASRSGYEITGYTVFKRVKGENVQMYDTAEYNMDAPTWLKLFWKLIGKPASEEPKAKTTSIPTSLSADQVKVGAYVRRGNLLFRIIEVTDNDIRVATVGKLSEQALADMLGFLKQHLSDAQIAKIIGEPELLEQELVTHFFGDRNEHIAFRAAKDLFE